MRTFALLVSAIALAACQQPQHGNDASANADPEELHRAPISLTRLDCGTVHFDNFDAFFSDKPGLYPAGPRDVTDSRHGDQLMLWDTGLSADVKGKKVPMGPMVMSLDRTIEEQLAELGIKPADIDIVGISHHHGDHTGQAALFPQARLIIGAGDFEKAKAPPEQGGPSPIAPWLKEGSDVTKATGDVDIFGDGSVVTVHLPGHTPDHMGLLVNLKSGQVLLTGDLYHSTDAREKRGVPPFNSSREQTIASMDRFEANAKDLGANGKVIIQHEPADIGKLPAFPKAAQ